MNTADGKLWLYSENLIKLNLQFFAADGPGGEKTEEPTVKKLQDARKEGQVAKSQELVIAASLLLLFVILKIFVGVTANRFVENFNYSASLIGNLTNNQESSLAIFSGVINDSIIEIMIELLPYIVSAVLVAFIVNVFQVKWQITTKPLQPKLSKFNPVSGIKKIFSKDKLFELLKAILKIVFIGIIAYTTLRDQYPVLFRLTDMSLMQGVAQIGDIVISLGLKISGFYAVLGIIDFVYQKSKFKKEMMMTKQEIKEEFKQTEGDPQVKGQIKQKMREASRRRMMQRIPEADVVITNPTHFACAIKYDREVNQAPVLLAKGADYLAQKIKETARENFVPIVENKPLARMLYMNVEIDQEIPPELYQMAADVLAYVYSLKAG